MKRYLTIKKLSIYIVILMVNILLWNGIFNHIYKIPDTEKIQVFITAEYTSDDLEHILKQNLENDNIKEVTLTTVPLSNRYYQSLLSTKGFVDSDIIILPEKYLKDFDVEDTFLSLDDYINNLNTQQIFYKDSTAYGIKIFDLDNDYSPLSKYLNFSNYSEPLYVVVNKSSINSSKESNNSFNTLSELLNLFRYD